MLRLALRVGGACKGRGEAWVMVKGGANGRFGSDTSALLSEIASIPIYIALLFPGIL